jgi:hypothetical protein
MNEKGLEKGLKRLVKRKKLVPTVRCACGMVRGTYSYSRTTVP